MTRYEEILADIEQDDDIMFFETKSKKQPAKSMRMGQDCAIFFNESAFETDADRFTGLVHEDGHCISGAFYGVNTPFETKERCEQRAWRRGIQKYLPFDDLMDAFEACKTVDGVILDDLAKYLSMPTDFVTRAIELYGQLGKMIL